MTRHGQQLPDDSIDCHSGSYGCIREIRGPSYHGDAGSKRVLKCYDAHLGQMSCSEAVSREKRWGGRIEESLKVVEAPTWYPMIGTGSNYGM